MTDDGRPWPRAVLAASVVAVSLLFAACTSASHDRTPSKTAQPNTSPSNASTPAVTTDSPPATEHGCPAAPQGTVTDAASLTRALATVKPGGRIVLAPGVYAGNFTASGSGTAAAPITLCGPRSAVLDGGTIKRHYTLHLSAANWWHVSGFTVQHGQKGVVLDHSGHNVIADLAVHGIGDEAIHLRAASSDNLVRGNVISGTGQHKTKFGEGIYIGSANKNWCLYSKCLPDDSDRNMIQANEISNTTAESVDVKEGTSGGQILDNRFSGVGMVADAATAWVNVKGNGWTIQGNVGVTSPRDGFQVHQVLDGWGQHDVFRANRAKVDGPGWGYYVQSTSLYAMVSCDNVVTGAGSGLTNGSCA